MNFVVLTYRRADHDIRAAVLWMAENLSPRVARSWHAGLLAAVASLEANPERCPLADEAGELGVELRELVHRRRRTAYRILFTIAGDTVNVIRVRHTAQDRLTDADI
jgi:plasmid stabilization system protein ParE